MKIYLCHTVEDYEGVIKHIYSDKCKAEEYKKKEDTAYKAMIKARYDAEYGGKIFPKNLYDAGEFEIITIEERELE